VALRRWVLPLFVLPIFGAALLAAPGAAGRPNIPTASITPVITGTLGSNGWYRSNVTVNWAIEPFPMDSTGCDSRTLVNDTAATSITCTAIWPGPFTITVTVTIRIDKTPPSITGGADRAPDANGWYNRPLVVRFSGNDAMSGLQGCSSAPYSGPDSANVAVGGTCRDNAGNVTNGAFPFRFDSTPPTVSMLTVKPGKRSATLRWQSSADTQLVELTRSPGRAGAASTVVYRGKGKLSVDRGLVPGRAYRYTLSAYDQALNHSERALDFVGRGALTNPAPGARVQRPPLLTWARARGASYYNVLIVYRGRRVFAAWPLRPRLQLGRRWTYRGRRYRLRPGVYRWYVFPGYGSLAAARFGNLLGGSTFVVTR
jgi:hypothetical protein